MISYNKYWILKTKEIDLSTTLHHPSYHQDTNNIQCPLCDLSLESIRQSYNRENPNAKINGEFIEMEIMEDQEILPAVKKESTSPIVEKVKDKIISTSDLLGLAISKRKEQLELIKSKVNESVALRPTGFNGKQVLYMPEVGYTRSLSIIESLRKLEEQIGGKINKNYDIISGSGNSALIATLLSKGMVVQEIKRFWLNNWINAYRVSIKDRLIRSFTVKSVHGYRVKKAKDILSKAFSFGGDNKKLMTFNDLEEEVFLPAAFGRFKETEIYSKGNTPEETLVDALIDTVIDPNHFDAVETIKGKGVPIPIKDFEFNILLNSKAVLLTKIDVPFLHSDYGDLNHASEGKLNKPSSDLDSFNTKTNLESFSKNYSPKRVKIETGEIPSVIPKNSTESKAIDLAIEAGKNPRIIRY